MAEARLLKSLIENNVYKNVKGSIVMIKNGKKYQKEFRGTPDCYYTEEVEILRCYYTCSLCHMRYNFKNKKQVKRHFKYETGYGIAAYRRIICNKCITKGRGKRYVWERKEALRGQS